RSHAGHYLDVHTLPTRRSSDLQTMPERLQSLVDDGENAEVVLVFQREVVGLPAEVIDQIRNSPMFDELTKLAQSIVYDSTLTREDRKSTRLNSSHVKISYAVCC